MSTDLAADLKQMWETQTLKGDADTKAGQTPKASTVAAIDAALRVFNTVELVGKTQADIIAELGDPKASNESIYNFPFYRAPSGSMIYRFDNGAYGWQFNVRLNAAGVCTAVERLGIE